MVVVVILLLAIVITIIVVTIIVSTNILITLKKAFTTDTGSPGRWCPPRAVSPFPDTALGFPDLQLRNPAKGRALEQHRQYVIAVVVVVFVIITASVAYWQKSPARQLENL